MRKAKQTVQKLSAVWAQQSRAGRLRQYVLVMALSLSLCAGAVGTATATQTSNSPNYSVTETQFGCGSIQHQCSTSYCAKASAGDTTVGNTSSNTYGAQSGSNNDGEPLLEVTVSGGNQDLGVLDNTHTGTATSTIDVRIYNSSGYTLFLAGAAPSQGTHTITSLLIPTASQQGQEQFGVNMVDNATPNIGADPINEPEGDSALGYVEDSYKVADSYKYIPGDTLATYPGNGQALYTLSMIMNVSNVTPGGRYKGSFAAVVVPIF
jgi:hypothetical protein